MRWPRGGALYLNLDIVGAVVAGALTAVGAGMLVCAGTALAYGDGAALAFGGPGAVTVALGAVGLFRRGRGGLGILRARDGYFAVTAAWVVSAVVGAVPFLLHGTFTHPVDALFESMSGLTACGATLLSDVEAEPHAVLLWRSLSHWLGGVGIVLLVVAVAPATGLASQRLFFAEASTPTVERLTPRIADTAKIIWGVYLTLTAVGVGAFVLAGMGAFDAVNHAFSTVATGGFSTRTASIGAFDSVPVELVAMALMLASGVNLAFYWRAVRGDPLRLQVAEVATYLSIVAAATAAIAVSLLVADDVGSWVQSLRAAGFAVISLMTSTGFVTADFDTFNDFVRLTLVGLTFIGACAGSTSGGMKVVRIMLLARTGVQEVQRQLQPQAVQVLRLPGRVFSEHVRRTVLGFFFLYLTVWAAGALLMTALGLELVTAASSASTALTLAGAGVGEVGASENFTAVPQAGRAVLSLLMLIGRLEVFTVVALLTPAFWRRQWA